MGKWRTYEWLVYNYFCKLYEGNWKVEYDVKIVGKSGILRQVDILLSESNFKLIVAIDCKCYKKSLDIKEVETFIGMLYDLQASKGILVTLKGYSAGALKRAKEYGRLDLLALSIEDLFSYRFYNNKMIDISCPICDGLKDIFTNRTIHSAVSTMEYDIVYRHDMNSFVKVNTAFCTNCVSQIFHCTQCNITIGISVDDIRKNVIKRCKCGIGYSFYEIEDEFGQKGTCYSYYDINGEDLLSENNLMCMDNNW